MNYSRRLKDQNVETNTMEISQENMKEHFQDIKIEGYLKKKDTKP